jgi:hypothetical protein
MIEYRGLITIAAAAKFGYADIDPPERVGYVHRIMSLTFAPEGDDTANDAHVLLGASSKAVARTSLSLTSDGIPVDVLALGRGNFELSEPVSLMIPDKNLYVVPDPLFQDSVRLFAATEAAVAASTSITAGYVLVIEEVRLTGQIQQDLARRLYT